MTRRKLSLLLLLAASIAAPLSAGTHSAAAFKKLQSLAGDWEGKQANSDYVRQQFGLALSRGPIFGLVARLVHQKGVDLVLSAAGTS